MVQEDSDMVDETEQEDDDGEHDRFEGLLFKYKHNLVNLLVMSVAAMLWSIVDISEYFNLFDAIAAPVTSGIVTVVGAYGLYMYRLSIRRKKTRLAIAGELKTMYSDVAMWTKMSVDSFEEMEGHSIWMTNPTSSSVYNNLEDLGLLSNDEINAVSECYSEIEKLNGLYDRIKEREQMGIVHDNIGEDPKGHEIIWLEAQVVTVLRTLNHSIETLQQGVEEDISPDGKYEVADDLSSFALVLDETDADVVVTDKLDESSSEWKAAKDIAKPSDNERKRARRKGDNSFIG